MSMQFVIIHNDLINNDECHMMTCKNFHVDYFLWYYDGIANALVACWGVMIDRTPQMGREGHLVRAHMHEGE